MESTLDVAIEVKQAAGWPMHAGTCHAMPQCVPAAHDMIWHHDSYDMDSVHDEQHIESSAYGTDAASLQTI